MGRKDRRVSQNLCSSMQDLIRMPLNSLKDQEQGQSQAWVNRKQNNWWALLKGQCSLYLQNWQFTNARPSRRNCWTGMWVGDSPTGDWGTNPVGHLGMSMGCSWNWLWKSLEGWEVETVKPSRPSSVCRELDVIEDQDKTWCFGAESAWNQAMVLFSPYNQYRVPGMPILGAHRMLGLGLALHILIQLCFKRRYVVWNLSKINRWRLPVYLYFT